MKTVAHILREKGGGIWAVESAASVLAALEQMADRNVGALLVIDGDEIAGIVSERDYARKGILHGRRSDATTVAEIMTSTVVSVNPTTTVEECIELMTE